jgi:acetyl-CoA carboxylase biotin carboxyl carrier protein
MVEIQASMSGHVWKINVQQHDAVKAGDILIILESMKMEILLECTHDGVVDSINVAEGDYVEEGAVIALIKTE